MKKTGIFREELPGEKKTIINLVVMGYLVSISCMGYMTFFALIQLAQIKKILGTMNHGLLTAEQFDLLKVRLFTGMDQLSVEMIGLAVAGIVVCVIAGFYTFNLLIRPLRQLVDYTETKGKTELPEFKANHELKQLATAISSLTPESEKKEDLLANTPVNN